MVDATGTHVFTYDYATAGHPGLASATVPYILNHKVEYGYDTLGKRTSMQLLNNNSPVVNHQYAYDTQNSLASVRNTLTLSNDGVLWNLTWNGENRLIVAESADKRLEFTYDYMGRRVRKQVYTGSSGNWTLASESKYAYDGWNCIAIFNGSDVMQKSYLWGEDLSGSLQGAGGVGGLLAVIDATATYFPMYDGNGNIMTYVDPSGTLKADYTYDPFGRTISQTGDSATELTYRFSTKPIDTITGLYYYGYRYYSPDLGRWLSRDPIEEKGGYNLYSMVGNNPISHWDYLGLRKCCTPAIARDSLAIMTRIFWQFIKDEPGSNPWTSEGTSRDCWQGSTKLINRFMDHPKVLDIRICWGYSLHRRTVFGPLLKKKGKCYRDGYHHTVVTVTPKNGNPSSRSFYMDVRYRIPYGNVEDFNKKYTHDLPTPMSHDHGQYEVDCSNPDNVLKQVTSRSSL